MGTVSPGIACPCVQLHGLLIPYPFAWITQLFILDRKFHGYPSAFRGPFQQCMSSECHLPFTIDRKSKSPDHYTTLTSHAHWVYAKGNISLGKLERKRERESYSNSVGGSSPSPLSRHMSLVRGKATWTTAMFSQQVSQWAEWDSSILDTVWFVLFVFFMPIL